jgi:hypothetical protein
VKAANMRLYTMVVFALAILFAHATQFALVNQILVAVVEVVVIGTQIDNSLTVLIFDIYLY